MSRSGTRTSETRSSESLPGDPGSARTARQTQTLDLLFASGELLPSQMPVRSVWSAEKKLAAAVLEGALTEIRNYGGTLRHVRSLKAALEWVRSDDTTWPYSFRPLCELFSLDVDWVRQRVAAWATEPRPEEVSRSRYRHAA